MRKNGEEGFIAELLFPIIVLLILPFFAIKAFINAPKYADEKTKLCNGEISGKLVKSKLFKYKEYSC